MTVRFDLLRAALRGVGTVQQRGDYLVLGRLPSWTRDQWGGDILLTWASPQASGARLELTTAATWIELVLRAVRVDAPDAGFRLRPVTVTCTADGERSTQTIDAGDIVTFHGDWEPRRESGEDATLRFDLGAGGARDVTIWLPHNCIVELREVRGDAEIVAAKEQRRRWVHYGSSISHCIEAEWPDETWPALVAQALDLDLYNLGMAGCAQLDGFAARTIKDTPADLITLKVGINVVNGDTLRARTFIPTVHSFLDAVREGHPDVPIVVISPIATPIHEDEPGPTEWNPEGFAGPSTLPRRPDDGRLTLRKIRGILAQIVDQRALDDPDLHYVDGTALFGLSDSDLLPDRLHPDAGGYRLMGTRFSAIALKSTWFGRGGETTDARPG